MSRIRDAQAVRYGALVLTHTRGKRHVFLVVMTTLVAEAAVKIVSPQIVRAFLDGARAGDTVERLLQMAALFIGISIAGLGLEVLRSHAANVVGWHAMNNLRRKLFRHTIDLGLSFFARSPPGMLLERVDGDVGKLRRLLSDLMVELLANLLMGIGIIIVLLLEDWRIGFAVAAFAFVGVVVFDRVRALGVPRFVRSREASAAFFGRLSEWLTAVEDLRPLAGQRYIRMSYERALARWLPREVAAQIAGHAMAIANTLVFIGGTALALTVSVGLYRAGLLTIGTVWLVSKYSELIRGPISALRSELQQIQEAQASLKRIDELLSHSNDAHVGEGRLPPGPCAVEFDRVSFSYADGAPVLRDVTFELAPGSVLGLVGSTGSGKTTIANLVARVVEVQGGEVRVGGISVRDLPSGHLRQRVAFMPQETEIIPGSLRDNVTLFEDTVSAAAVIAAFDGMGAGAWLRRLPQGVDTTIGHGATELSSGERQLVAIARILMTDPSVVILDEPAARIDPVTETLVQRALRQLLAGRTGLVIAHRVTTLKLVDSIALLDRGAIVERISRADLNAGIDSRITAFFDRGGSDESGETP